ncbi:MAG: prolyl oligopeptidase family serine peptidase [Candidatus Saccharicenans sp.]|nr:prolyl oligopeptidase family serine peptidase [Candidatus Saccharicenans sp.]
MKKGQRYFTRFMVLIIFCFSVLADYAEAGPPSFNLEAVMSAPHTSQLVAAPGGSRVAWVLQVRGQKSIWLAEGPGYAARRLVNYEQDDGQVISGLQFTPDGEALIYAYGSTFNPTSNPRPAEQAIKLMDLKSGKETELVKGASPSISPDGRNLLFIRGSEPWLMALDGSAATRRLFQARGRSGSFSWSPDSRKVVFVSSREAHNFIGVYDLEKDTITWLLPDVYRDESPVWSPDGKRVAFLRLPPGKEREKPLSRRSDVPFSIWVAEVESGTGKVVLELEKGGGFAQSYSSNPLVWADGDWLVFYSEHTGWMHLYSVSVGSGKMVALTSGEFEVEQMSLAPDRKTVLFNSNRGDINRRHLWKVSVAGGKVEPVTGGKSVEWSPAVSADGQMLFFVQSTARRPGLPVMMDLKKREVVPLVKVEAVAPEFPAGRLVEPQQVIFQAKDGLTVHGQLFLPEGLKDGVRVPAVIFMHGGPIRQMYPAWHQSPYYHNCYAFNQYLAACGYAVLSVNFRCGIGYGAAFREAANQGPEGASEYLDILAGAAYLKGHSNVDASRIGLWGGSYGGYLTALGLARNSDLFAAGVDFHGVHDWAMRGRRRSGGGWGIFEEQEKLAIESSPVADVEKWTSPVLFVHGDDDRNVDFIQTTDLVARLKELGKAPVETLIFPDDVHSFLLHRNWVRAFSAARDFFDRHLRKK